MVSSRSSSHFSAFLGGKNKDPTCSLHRISQYGSRTLNWKPAKSQGKAEPALSLPDSQGYLPTLICGCGVMWQHRIPGLDDHTWEPRVSSEGLSQWPGSLLILICYDILLLMSKANDLLPTPKRVLLQRNLESSPWDVSFPPKGTKISLCWASGLKQRGCWKNSDCAGHSLSKPFNWQEELN